MKHDVRAVFEKRLKYALTEDAGPSGSPLFQREKDGVLTAVHERFFSDRYQFDEHVLR